MTGTERSQPSRDQVAILPIPERYRNANDLMDRFLTAFKEVGNRGVEILTQNLRTPTSGSRVMTLDEISLIQDQGNPSSRLLRFEYKGNGWQIIYTFIPEKEKKRFLRRTAGNTETLRHMEVSVSTEQEGKINFELETRRDPGLNLSAPHSWPRNGKIVLDHHTTTPGEVILDGDTGNAVKKITELLELLPKPNPKNPQV